MASSASWGASSRRMNVVGSTDDDGPSSFSARTRKTRLNAGASATRSASRLQGGSRCAARGRDRADEAHAYGTDEARLPSIEDRWKPASWNAQLRGYLPDGVRVALLRHDRGGRPAPRTVRKVRLSDLAEFAEASAGDFANRADLIAAEAAGFGNGSEFAEARRLGFESAKVFREYQAFSRLSHAWRP